MEFKNLGTRQRVSVLQAVVLAIAMIGLAVPAQAVVAQYTATYFAGLGDGGNPPTTPSNAPNGLPVCNQGLQPHLNAMVPAAGFAATTPMGGLNFAGPFAYGTPGPTGPAPFQKAGVAGINGAAQYVASTCLVAFPASVLPAILFARTQMSSFTWPAEPGVLSPGGGYGTGMASTAVPGTGMGFVWTRDSAQSQFISAIAGPNKFGGGVPGDGQGRVDLGVNTPGSGMFLGFWNTGPRPFGHAYTGVPTSMATPNEPYPTLNRIQNTGIFTLTSMTSVMVPVKLDVGLFPWTTGTVYAKDAGGQFTTIRTSMGTDARNAAGTTGVLQIVSPWEASLEPFLNLFFGGTARVNFQFTPEPTTTGLLAFGVMGLVAAHRVGRRRRA